MELIQLCAKSFCITALFSKDLKGASFSRSFSSRKFSSDATKLFATIWAKKISFYNAFWCFCKSCNNYNLITVLIFQIVLYKLKRIVYLHPLSGCSVARLSRLLWEQEAAGSNPATPTKVERYRSAFFIFKSYVLRLHSIFENSRNILCWFYLNDI